MAYNTKNLITDASSIKPVPQEFNELIDDYEELAGVDNASLAVHGRVYQVGSGATTTSIPLLTSTGLSVSLTSAIQSALVGSTFEINLSGTINKASVTAVSAAGTLTLDSAIASAPAQGTKFVLSPPEKTMLMGRNVPIQSVTGYIDPTKITVNAGSTYTLRIDNLDGLSQLRGLTWTWGGATTAMSQTIEVLGNFKDSAGNPFFQTSLVSVTNSSTYGQEQGLSLQSDSITLSFKNGDSVNHTLQARYWIW